MTDFFSDSALNNLTQHLLPGLWPFVFALIVSAVAVPFAAVLSRRFGVVAQPGGRHAHTKPTPLLGGFAMWLGFAIAVFVFAAHNLQTLGLLLVSGLATGLLIIDDRWSMRPLVKLAVQVGLALLAVLVFNFQIGYIGLPGGHILEFALPIAVAVSVFWLVGMQNTVNFLDGADGFLAGYRAGHHPQWDTRGRDRLPQLRGPRGRLQVHHRPGRAQAGLARQGRRVTSAA